MKRFYSAADVFLCPSPYEPFGLVLIEAFASATPVIAAQHGGPAEIVTPGMDGYLVDPTIPQNLAEQTLRFLRLSEEDRRKMAAAAVRKARAVYSWHAVVSRIAEVYREVAHRSGGPPGTGEEP